MLQKSGMFFSMAMTLGTVLSSTVSAEEVAFVDSASLSKEDLVAVRQLRPLEKVSKNHYYRLVYEKNNTLSEKCTSVQKALPFAGDGSIADVHV